MPNWNGGRGTRCNKLRNGYTRLEEKGHTNGPIKLVMVGIQYSKPKKDRTVIYQDSSLL
jgi:hypothetical protein